MTEQAEKLLKNGVVAWAGCALARRSEGMGGGSTFVDHVCKY